MKKFAFIIIFLVAIFVGMGGQAMAQDLQIEILGNVERDAITPMQLEIIAKACPNVKSISAEFSKNALGSGTNLFLTYILKNGRVKEYSTGLGGYRPTHELIIRFIKENEKNKK